MTLNWVVVGIGDITSKRVIPAIHAEPRSRLYGVVTRDPAKAAAYPGARVWTELEAALADPAVSAVYVATPVSLHRAQTVAALQAGKHVLCEKPTGMNYAEACAMVEAGRASGKVFGVAYYRRMYPKVLRALELVRAGAIGRPVLAELTAHSWLLPDEHPGAWRHDPAMAGGGPLYDIASHRIDLLNYYFGTPLRATALLSNAVHAIGTEDSASVLVAYEGGVHGYVDVRWNSHVARDEFRIVGTDGEMRLTPLNGPELTYPGGEESIPAPGNLHYPCVENFVAAVLDGAPLASSGESALWTDWVTAEALAGCR